MIRLCNLTKMNSLTQNVNMYRRRGALPHRVGEMAGVLSGRVPLGLHGQSEVRSVLQHFTIVIPARGKVLHILTLRLKLMWSEATSISFPLGDLHTERGHGWTFLNPLHCGELSLLTSTVSVRSDESSNISLW
jgi:hypothetical protein